MIVLAGESFLKELILGFKRLKIELVLIDSLNYFSPQCNEVRAGNYAGGIECAEYLCKKGHKNFAFLRYDTFSYSMRQRCAGFEYGLDFFGKYQPVTFSCAEEVPALDDSIEQFLNTLQYPCAVFCANDFLASYLYYHAEQRGLKIPGDLSVVGFDNSSGELMDKITTFDIPKELLGARAVDLLIDRINEPDKPVEIIEIAVKMVERESVMDFTAKGNKS